jgi:hypothetical protein
MSLSTTSSTKIISLSPNALQNPVYKKWHQALDLAFNNHREEAAKIMSEIFDDKIEFLPPTYAKKRIGKAFAMKAIEGVSHLFKEFRYTREFIGDRDFVLEFVCKTGEHTLYGADMIKLNTKGDKIVEFMVLARPPAAVQKILEHQSEFMKPFLAAMKDGGGEGGNKNKSKL